MSFNSFHRRGSRSAVQATLALQDVSEADEVAFRTVSALDVHVLNNPIHYENEAVSEDSRLYTNEVKSEEFAILSTSSEREANHGLESSLAEERFEIAGDQELHPEQIEESAISKSQRIDDWCLQSNTRSEPFKTPANRRIQDIIEAWGVEDRTPCVHILRPFNETRPTDVHPDNYTAHILDLLSPAQRLRLASFSEQLLPLLKKRLRASFAPYRFKSIPSVFVNKELQWHYALDDKDVLLSLRDSSDSANASESSYAKSTTLTASNAGLRSWYGWNVVPSSKSDHIPGF